MEELTVSLVSSVSPLLTRRGVNRGQSCMKKLKRSGSTPVVLTLEAGSYIDLRIEKTSTCWNWRGSVAENGYGTVWSNGKSYKIHRVVYELSTNRVIPKGMVIDHLCRNRTCVNPKHLEVVTSRENILRGIGVTAKNKTKTKCIRGHEYIGENLRTRVYDGDRIGRVCRACTKLYGTKEYLARRKRLVYDQARQIKELKHEVKKLQELLRKPDRTEALSALEALTKQK